MAQERTPNTELAAVIDQTGLSHAQIARAVVRVAVESGATESAHIGRSHVSHWVAGSRPSGRAPELLREALSRRLGRSVTVEEIGLGHRAARMPDWQVDTLIALADLGRDDVDADRRRLLGAAAYSVAALALPGATWWDSMIGQGAARSGSGGRPVGQHDLEAVRDMVALFSQVDQRRGGGHARTAVVQYLTTDVARLLRGTFRDERVRRETFSASSELAYLCGWMAFDNAEHAIAQHYFTVAVKLAAEADDAPMAGHVLRAMAHQAVDLGHPQHALDLAVASIEGRRYRDACSRERSLLGVVHARALAASGQRKAAAVALLRAETDLAAACEDDNEPSRVFFFSEASLAHESAATLRDVGDLHGAVRMFKHSVATRKATAFARTHAVTLGYLGAVHARRGALDEACATWSQALDAMEGIRSGRTRRVAEDIHATLGPFRQRGLRTVAELDTRAADYLARTA
jgi:hypothetical protein